MLKGILAEEALRFEFLLQSDGLTDIEHKRYQNLVAINDKGEFLMSDKICFRKTVLYLLSIFLQKHYWEKNTIISY